MGILGAMQEPTSSPHLGTQRNRPIMPEMSVVASDPIGAFQVVNDTMMDLIARVEALEAALAELKQNRPVH